ncbi:MAG TPA: hypothetical protein VNC50_17790 [Planctomycetia bacterium]|nr:hypothetical protein [Planctomycetia bacterium]
MVYQDSALRDSWDDFSSQIELAVRSKIGGRLADFSLGRCDGQLVLQGAAASYHVKQLAQHEVMMLTPVPIHSNRIEVCAT